MIKLNEAASIGKASMKFLIDRLINVMEKYGNEREFITHMKKEIHLKPEDSKKVWKLYWRTKKIGKAGVLWEKDWKKLLAIKLGIRESMKMIKLKDILNEKSLNEAPEHQLAGELDKVSNSIFKIMKRYEKKADVEGMVRAWMLGLHSRLKRSGVKI